MKKFMFKKKITNNNWVEEDGKFILKMPVIERDRVQKVYVPEGAVFVSKYSFYNCISLTEIHFPKSFKNLDGDFFDCAVEKIYIQNADNNIVDYIPSNFDFICKDEEGFCISRFCNNNNPTSRFLHSKYLLPYMVNYWDDKEKMSRLDVIRYDESYLVSYLVRKYSDTTGCDLVEKVLDNNIKNYNLLLKQINYCISPTYLREFARFCDALGVFTNQPVITQRTSKSGKIIVETVDYAQKSREFIREFIRKGTNLSFLNSIAMSRISGGFKKEFADFVFLNFPKIIEQGPEFLVACYLRFDEVQTAHTKNKGSCKQLAPTVDFFVKYFDETKFKGITDKNRYVAKVIGKYYNEQYIFDNAVSAVELAEKNNIPEHILNHELKGYVDLKSNYIDKNEAKQPMVFDRIKNKLTNIAQNSQQTLNTLCDISNKKFTYEFLRKHDVVNLVLGKLCNCCAHLDGVGNGIAISVMAHPDIQNIVVKDSDGVIVGKGTLYINREQGYGVCNSFQVSTKVCESSSANLKLVYKTFKKGLIDFAKEYNKEFEPKLKVINVGGSVYNSLLYYVKKDCEIADELLDPIDFSTFSFMTEFAYDGDAIDSQYTIWKADEKSR